MTCSKIFIWIVTFLVIILFELVSSYQHSAEHTASIFRVKVTSTFNVVAVSANPALTTILLLNKFS